MLSMWHVLGLLGCKVNVKEVT